MTYAQTETQAPTSRWSAKAAWAPWLAVGGSALLALSAISLAWYEATYTPSIGDVAFPELGDEASKSITRTGWQASLAGKGVVVLAALAAVAAVAVIASRQRQLRNRAAATSIVASLGALGLVILGLVLTPKLNLPIETFSGEIDRDAVTLSYDTTNNFWLYVSVAIAAAASVGVVATVLSWQKRPDATPVVATIF